MPLVARTENYVGYPEYYEYYLRWIKELNLEIYKVSAQTFHKALDMFNKIMRDAMVWDAFEWILPARCGKMAVYRYIKKIRKKANGEYNLPIHWPKTYALWENDPEAREKKKKIYVINGAKNRYTYKIFFLNHLANFKKKSVYRFKPASPFSKSVKTLAMDPGKFDVEHFIYEKFHNP